MATVKSRNHLNQYNVSETQADEGQAEAVPEEDRPESGEGESSC